MRSSATTNIIAPAAKERSHGIQEVKLVASHIPSKAKIGSTIPLPAPYKKAFQRLPVSFYKGRLTAAPSGKFCMAKPIDNPSAAI